jgi:hypothetical protein
MKAALAPREVRQIDGGAVYGDLLVVNVPAEPNEVFASDAFATGRRMTVKYGTRERDGVIVDAEVTDGGRAALVTIDLSGDPDH